MYSVFVSYEHMETHVHIHAHMTKKHVRTQPHPFANIHIYACICVPKKMMVKTLNSFLGLISPFSELIRCTIRRPYPLFTWRRVYAKLNEYKGATQLLVQHGLSQKLARSPWVVAAHERIRQWPWDALAWWLVCQKELHYHDVKAMLRSHRDYLYQNFCFFENPVVWVGFWSPPFTWIHVGVNINKH